MQRGPIDGGWNCRVVYMHYLEFALTDAQTLLVACACTKLRTAARMATRAYDEALAPVGLTAAQLAVLAAIDQVTPTSIAELSSRLVMDRTTLSRNLKPLEREGLIVVGLEGWRRSRTVRLTERGQARITQAMVHWESAQANFKRQFGAGQWKLVEPALQRFINSD